MKIVIECEPKEMADFISELSQPFKTKLFVPEINVEFGKTNYC